MPTAMRVRRRPVLKTRTGNIYSYDLANLYKDYGNPQMGDLFNDIMGAVVPNWDKRPDWMKKIRVKPDPAKLVQTAAKVLPPKEVGRVVNQAAKYGIDLKYKTPAGEVPITGNMIAQGYGNFPAIAQFTDKMKAVPTWVYMAGGVGLVLIVFMAAKK